MRSSTATLLAVLGVALAITCASFQSPRSMLSSVAAVPSIARAGAPLSFVLFGATGRSGIPFVRQALERGHRVTALLRSANKLPSDIIDHPNLRAVEVGLDETERITDAIGSARPDVVYMMLNSEAAPYTAVSTGTRQTLSALRALRESSVGSTASSVGSAAPSVPPVRPVPLVAVSAWSAGPTRPYVTRWYEKLTHACAGLFAYHRNSFADTELMIQMAQAAKEEGLIQPVILVPAVLTSGEATSTYEFGDAHEMKDRVTVFSSISRENMASVAVELGEKTARGEVVPEFVALRQS